MNKNKFLINKALSLMFLMANPITAFAAISGENIARGIGAEVSWVIIIVACVMLVKQFFAKNYVGLAITALVGGGLTVLVQQPQIFLNLGQYVSKILNMS